jgi:O-antigen/teichoic acid export membrane protein
LGNIIGAVLTGIFWLVLATIQGVGDYGQINYVISIGSLTASIALLGLNTTVTTLLPKGESKIIVQANQIILISATICAVIVSSFNWILGPFVISMSFWMMASYELIAQKSYKKYALNVIGARGTQLILSLGLYYVLGSPGLVLGFIIAFFAFSRPFFSSIRNFDFHLADAKKIFRTSLHLYSYNLSNAFLLYFDKLIIGPLFGYVLLGYYQLGFQFLMFFSMIPVSFYQYLVSHESGGKKENKLRIYSILFSVLLSALFFLFAPQIITLFFHNYGQSINSMRILSVGIVPMMIISTLNSRFLSLNLTKYIMFSSILYQVLQVILLILLGNRYGIEGISSSVVISMACQSIFLFVSYLKTSTYHISK